ncbi:MAG: hypothetical protein ACTSYF_10065, partial [Promethearchaeota archaeon]
MIKNKKNTREAWKVKFEFLIQRLGDLISQEGKKMVLINIEAERDPNIQFEKYKDAVELVRNQMECVVSTSLPGEERIFWSYHDVQFYIRDDKDAISSTGNSNMIQKVFSTENQEIKTFIPGLEYWKDKNFEYQLDTTDYVDEQKLSAGEISLNSQEIIEKFGQFHTTPFENKEWWYVLKFFFIASEFNNLDGFGELIGGIPRELKIKCECEGLLDVEFYWKGVFKVPEQEFEHQYYLYVSHVCEDCGKRVCVYRPRGPYCPHLLTFMSHLVPERKFKMTDIEMVSMWQDAFKRGAIKDMERFQHIYNQDVIKFGNYIM